MFAPLAARATALAVALSLSLSCVPPDDVEPPVDPESINIDGKGDSILDLLNLVDLLAWARDQAAEILYTGKWTNWYKDGKVLGLVKLAAMRHLLDNENLFHSYPDGVRTGHAPAFLSCSSAELAVRQLDGRCNDLEDPMMGAAGTRFGHNVPVADTQPESAQQILDPNPREISRELLARDEFVQVDFLNLLAAAWIQFMVHDWFSHGDNRTDAHIAVPLAADDPMRVKYGIGELEIARTRTDDSRNGADGSLPPTYQNEVTHWWDGSQLYGSDRATADRLRSFSGGRLKLDGGGFLPLAADGFEDTGFRRNWWVGLSLMHTLFAREHNAIANMLAQRNPSWSDQRLFDTARMINAALMAKIHTVEWTPAILPNPTLEKAMNANWYGLFAPLESFGISFDDPILFGIVGNSRDLKDVPFSITEEFVAVYRMHPLLPESLAIRDLQSGALVESVPVVATRNQGAAALTERVGLAELMYSFGTSHPGALVLGNYPHFLQDLVIPGVHAFDMGTTDIVRDRERGVPRYNDFRRKVRLKALDSFDELSDDPSVVAALEDIYDGDIEKLDLLVGCLAEAHRPTHFGFGETAFQIFTLMASRRLHADRFFTDSYNAQTYTQDGLDWVANNSMRTVLLRHYPELASTGLAAVDNAFEPWE